MKRWQWISIHKWIISFQPKHLHDSQDIRVILAEFILNFEFPRDVYTLLITGLAIYFTLKLFRFSIGLLSSLIRPIIFIVLILVSFNTFVHLQLQQELHFNRLFFVVVSDNSAIFIWNENGRLFKSTGFQCVFSNWGNLPEHLRCSEFRLHAYHTILCEKLLISQ